MRHSKQTCSLGDSVQLGGVQSSLPNCNQHVHLWLSMSSCMQQSSQVWLPEVFPGPCVESRRDQSRSQEGRSQK